MTHLKCSQCGLNNGDGAEVCERCGFRIGVERVKEEARLKQFQHVQRPRDRDKIFDLATGKQLSFH